MVASLAIPFDKLYLQTQKGEVYELIDHVKDKMESIESVLETGKLTSILNFTSYLLHCDDTSCLKKHTIFIVYEFTVFVRK